MIRLLLALAAAFVGAPALAQTPVSRTWNRIFDPSTVYEWNLTDPSWNTTVGSATTPGAWSNAAPASTAVFSTAVSGGTPGQTQRVAVNSAVALAGLDFRYADPLAAVTQNWRFEGSGALNFVPRSAGVAPVVSIGSLNSRIEVAVPITGDLSGNAAGLRLSGYGVLVLSGANTYTGNTTIEAGVVRLSGGANRLPVGTNLIISSQRFSGPAPNFFPGVLDLAGNDQTLAGLSINGGVGAPPGATSDGLEIRLGGATLTVGSGAFSDAPAGITGAGNFVKAGEGSFTLGGTNTYTGSTTVNGGTLNVDRSRNAATSGLPSTTDVVINAGTLRMSGTDPNLNPNNQSVRSLSGAGGVLETTGGTVFTFGAADTQAVRVFDGTIVGAGRAVKAGPGATVLNGTPAVTSYLTLDLNGGALVVNGAVKSFRPFTVAGASALAVLAGTGLVQAEVVVTALGTVAPGRQQSGDAPAGRLALTEANFAAGGTYQWQLAGLSTASPGANYDQILFDPTYVGALTLGGSSRVALDFSALPAADRPGAAARNAFWLQPHQWVILDYSTQFQANADQFATLEGAATDAGTFTLGLGDVASGGDIVLFFTPAPVPEPAAVLGVATGLLALGRTARRFGRA